MTKTIFACIPFFPWQSRMHICDWLILRSSHSGMQESIHFLLWHPGRMFWQVKMIWQLWTIYLGQCRQWHKSDHESTIRRKILFTVSLESLWLSLSLSLLIVCPWNGNHNYFSISLSYSCNFISFFSSFIYCIHPSCPLCIISSNKPSTFQNQVPKKDTEGLHPSLWVSSTLKTSEWA